MNLRITLLVLSILASAAVAQTTRLVPSQYPTIQSAITACINGDTVLVAPGTHSGPISFLGKAITVTSSGGASVTTIAGSSGVVVVTFAANEGSFSVLNGFTVSGGAGIQIQNSSPTIQNCLVINNVRLGPGAGIYCASVGAGTSSPSISGTVIANNISLTPSNNVASGLGFEGTSSATSFPSLTNCTIAANSSAQQGASDAGGVSISGFFNASFTGCSILDHASASGMIINSGSTSLTSCTIAGNHGDYGSAIYFTGTSLSLVNCLIAENAASVLCGAVYLQTSSSNPPTSLTIKNCTITSNTAGAAVGGVGHFGSGSPSIIITNSIIRGNTGTQIEASSASVTYCDVGMGLFTPGVGTINADPLFLDAGAGDFHLASNSPCKNAGAPGTTGLPSLDLDGTPRIVGGTVDMGADEVPALSFPGTPDGLDLYGKINGSGDPLASVRAAAVGSLLSVRMKSTTGSLVGGLPLFAARLYFTGNPFAVPGGGIWLDSQSVIVYGALSAPPFGFPGLPPDGLDFSFTVPAGLAGHTVRMQGLVTSVNALNGIYATSNATEVTF